MVNIIIIIYVAVDYTFTV